MSSQPFKCPFCNSTYSRKFNLERHIETMHPTCCANETIIKRQHPLQEVVLKLFLHGRFDTDEIDDNSIHFVTATYLISSLPKYAFDILWHLLTQLCPSKYYLLLELFTSENIYKAMNQFNTGENVVMPIEYKNALLQISAFVLENDMKQYMKFNNLVDIVFRTEKVEVSFL